MKYKIKIVKQCYNPSLIGVLVYVKRDTYYACTRKILCKLNTTNQYSFSRTHTHDIQLIKYLIENNIIKFIGTNSEIHEYCLTESVLLSLL